MKRLSSLIFGLAVCAISCASTCAAGPPTASWGIGSIPFTSRIARDVLATSIAGGGGSGSSTAETSILPLAADIRGSTNFPSNLFKPGQLIEFDANGYYSSKATSSGTLTIRVYLGSHVMGTATVTLTDAMTNKVWQLHSVMRVSIIGATGAINQTGTFLYQIGTAVAQVVPTGFSTSTVDTTAALPFNVTSQFSVSDANALIGLTNFRLASFYP